MAEEVDYIHKRALDGEALAHVHRRLDSAYDIVHETRERMIAVHNLLVEHIERDKEMKPALDELTTLWKGSKILIPIMAGAAATVWAVIAWAKDHLK